MCRTSDAGTGENDIGAHISEMLSRVGDSWTIQTVRALREGPLRFNELRRRIGGISQKMLTVTLRRLERDGFIGRTVYPTTPPQVEYTLTELGHSLQAPVCALVGWTIDNADAIKAARSRYDGIAEPDNESRSDAKRSDKPLAATDGRALSGS
ncbi:helix-turn-helix domain-containing protein [Notoacmeibacter sp. MSK16QG-6]|uniref:winged helix-turn-helix transcriptional regulator n=1 Tax=Notoacmeibacter sp. MSK16QG-6 TaxID=2957982 RepID=UPI00209D109D|nr:helix-turn-helix domain-containing protein [Notoacmeibacter sp. MSK16QG-6]MCP1200001.1 helix-turn-helix transcriptional regulator [Notoacmeibacter sp. MSK16QG-6]